MLGCLGVSSMDERATGQLDSAGQHAWQQACTCNEADGGGVEGAGAFWLGAEGVGKASLQLCALAGYVRLVFGC